MNWFYALGGQQQGPVNEAQLDALVAAGTINQETLVWREGMANWQPLRLARPASTVIPPVVATPPGVPPAPGTVAAPGEVLCAECGNSFTLDNVIQYGAVYVCGACKPIFLQRLREGAAPPPTAGGVVNEQQLLAREYRIEIGDCLNRAWKLFTENAGIFIGVSLLVFLVYMAVMVVSGLIPLLNNIVMLIIAGPLTGGYFWFMLKLARGEPAAVGDAFYGFSKRFTPLMLTSLVQGLLGFVCLIPMLIVLVVGGLGMASIRRGGGGMPHMAVGMLSVLILTFLLGLAGIVYVSTLWTHSYFLVVDKGYNFWPAMQLSRKLVQKRWWMTFLFNFVAGLIACGGIIGFCVGVVVTVPLYFAMRVWLYEDNFRDLAHFETPGSA